MECEGKAWEAVEEEAADIAVTKRKKLELPCCFEKGTGCYIWRTIVFLTVFPRRESAGEAHEHLT